MPRPDFLPRRPEVEFDLVLERLGAWGRDREWIGPDPYEGLNSPLGRMVRGHRARQAVTQAYKRLPFPPAWPLAVPAEPNTKTLALALSGYASSAGGRLSGADEFLACIPVSLERLNLADTGAAWGYHFDVHTRSIAYDRTTPNAIATCFVAGALLDAWKATGEDRRAQLALAARPYLLSLETKSRQGPFFAYVTSGSALIHNANLMVCGTLARLNELEPDPRAEKAIGDATQTSVALQHADGFWAYGERRDLGWVDNFHTAYLLEGLAAVAGGIGVGSDALASGVEAWRERLFEPDAAARYFPDQRFPLEPHSYASAIDLLCTLATVERPGEPAALDFAKRVAASAVRELWIGSEGRFAYRRTARGLNRRAFVRWTNAPMFRALSRLISALERPPSASQARGGATRSRA
jgi:polysaccharide biosynthesis protein VpsJ